MNKQLKLVLAALLSAGLVACASDAGTDESSAALSQPAGRYIIKFVDSAKGHAAVVHAGGKVALELPAHNAMAAQLPAQALAALQHNPNIEYIERDPERYPLAQTTPYGIDMVQATQVNDTATIAAIKTVCVIDSGVYTGHEDFAGLALEGKAGTDWNTDFCGHGTHVSGTIAAQDNTVGVIGVAPSSVKIHMVKVFGDDCAWNYASTLVAALDECKASGASVVSMSLGGGARSHFEDVAFAAYYNNGKGGLPIAAAGNGGNSQTSYPAGYSSVLSVAAVDSAKAKATFSQFNKDVELTAPGVSVLSTVPFIATASVTVDGATYNGSNLDGAATGSASGALVNGGLCDSVGSWSGKVVLCVRGTNTFGDKVANAETGGAAATVVYNNVPDGFAGTLNGTSAHPAISISQQDGQFLVANKLGVNADVASTFEEPASGFEAWNGTSMATPHVSGVAALIWSVYPNKTAGQVRAALDNTAEDLGARGRDVSYGYGLIRAQDALTYLGSH